MSNLPIYQQLSQLDEQAQKLAIQKSLYLKKAFESSDADEIFKAQQYLNKNQTNVFGVKNPDQGHRSLIFDPFETNTSQGFFRKNAQISFELLRQMGRSPLVNAVITTRKDQVLAFCEPQKDKYSKGYIIRKKGSNPKDEATDRDKREIDRLTKFLTDCADDEDVFDLDDFDSFVKKLIDDSLTLDQACFEVVRNRAKEPVQFLAVDGATIRLADSYDNVNNIEANEKKIDGYYPSYVQIYQNRIWQEYYPWEMCVGIRNPQTALNSNGYGRSELEILMATVTAMLNADSYNSKFFQNGTAPKGALLVKSSGGVNKDKLAELRRDWNATMVGSNNFHKTPVLDAEKIEWLDLQKSNRDMEFSAYQEYLIKLLCAVYKISPEEIGFPLQGSKSGGLGSKEGGAQEKEYSQDKGLKPLLKNLQVWINKFIIGPKSNNLYEFVFAGLDTEDSKEEEERLQKAVTLYMTIDEARAVRDLEPLPGGKGKIILNPAFLQQAQLEMQQNQMMADNAQPGYDDVDGGGEGSDKNPFVKALEDWWKDEMTAP